MRHAALLLLILGGCVTTTESALKGDVGYDVPIFMKGDAAAPTSGFEVIKTIDVKVSVRMYWDKPPDENAVLAAMRTQARKVDAQALVDVEVAGKSYADFGAATRSGTGKAIRYK